VYVSQINSWKTKAPEALPEVFGRSLGRKELRLGRALSALLPDRQAAGRSGLVKKGEIGHSVRQWRWSAAVSDLTMES